MKIGKKAVGNPFHPLNPCSKKSKKNPCPIHRIRVQKNPCPIRQIRVQKKI